MSEKVQTYEATSEKPAVFAIIFTENAARKVYSLIKEEGNFNLKLRVFITGGGCSGFQYGFAFEENVQLDDLVHEKVLDVNESEEGDSERMSVSLVVDPMSYQYLAGAEIDYVEDIDGERFIIRNPNAQTTCGCGSSFSM